MQPPPPVERPTLLLVEDDPPTRGLVRELLRNEGYGLLVATNGEEAVNVARAEAPDLVLLDLMLPKKSGWTVLEELKADPATREIPVIVVSAFGSPGAEDARARAARVVEKPFDLAELLAHIDQALRDAGRR